MNICEIAHPGQISLTSLKQKCNFLLNYIFIIIKSTTKNWGGLNII